jgi:hypothetical protein
MASLTGYGFAALAGGAGVLGFQAISALMHRDNLWNPLTLAGCAGDWVAELVEGLPEGLVQDRLMFLVSDLPLYQLLLGLGVVLIVLGAVFRR